MSIPHAGVLCPGEIDLECLSAHQEALADNVDWNTELLYDFRDLMGNDQVVFPISQVYVNVNRHPERTNECVPDSVDGLPIYREGHGPSADLKKLLIARYHDGYHEALRSRHKMLILDGHSTVSGLRDAAGVEVTADIILSDWQESSMDPPGGIHTAPKGYLEAYAEELGKRLRTLEIALNATYSATYGHVMAAHGWDGSGKAEMRAPLILQETNERLYRENGKANMRRLEELRRIFAESLAALARRLLSA